MNKKNVTPLLDDEHMRDTTLAPFNTAPRTGEKFTYCYESDDHTNFSTAYYDLDQSSFINAVTQKPLIVLPTGWLRPQEESERKPQFPEYWLRRVEDKNQSPDIPRLCPVSSLPKDGSEFLAVLIPPNPLAYLYLVLRYNLETALFEYEGGRPIWNPENDIQGWLPLPKQVLSVDGKHTFTSAFPKHTFTVTVEGCSKDQAEQVMGARLGVDEEMGFDYKVSYEHSVRFP